MEKERVIEIFLGGIFIMLLIIMIISFTTVSASGSKSTTTITISDSYNKYNIETTQPRYVYDSYDYNKYPTRYYKTNKPYYYNDRNYLKYNYRSYRDYQYSTNKPYYYNDRKHNRYDNNYNRQVYQDNSYYRDYKYTKGIFGNEINEYKVYLENSEHKSGYFTVKFYLADYEGRTRTESVTHYLKPYEGKVFRYKNVFDDEYDHAWNYKIISHVKTSNREYYPRYRY